MDKAKLDQLVKMSERLELFLRSEASHFPADTPVVNIYSMLMGMLVCRIFRLTDPMKVPYTIHWMFAHIESEGMVACGQFTEKQAAEFLTKKLKEIDQELASLG